MWSNEVQLTRLWGQLPQAAQLHYLYSLLVEEIQSTNEIENVHSTRHEIHEALVAARNQQNGQTRKRFQEMARAFHLFFETDTSAQLPTSLSGLRELYDTLLKDEISPDDRPDGVLFRRGPVSIIDGVNPDPVHRGASTEAEIHTRLQAMLDMQEMEGARHSCERWLSISSSNTPTLLRRKRQVWPLPSRIAPQTFAFCPYSSFTFCRNNA